MLWGKRDKEKERYYLLAGMGGSALRRKHRWILVWSLLAGAVIAGLMGLGFYFLNRRY